MKVEPGNILKLFLNLSNFEPQYSYRLYSYKKECMLFYKKHDNDHILHILSCNIERDIDEKSRNGSKTSSE